MRVVLCQFEGIEATPVLPLAAGLLVSAARAADLGCDLDIAVARGPIDAVVAELGAVDVAGFSLYPWNTVYALAVAAAVKAARPSARIVVGGPCVPRRPEAARAFLDAHPYVDVMGLSEGEVSFVKLLRAFRDGGPLDDIAGLAFRGAPHVVTAPPERVTTFSATASPFLDGTFDALFARHRGRFAMALCETNRGCPYSCTFCDWSLTKKIVDVPIERVIAEIDWVIDHGLQHMMLADANFGIRPRDGDIVRHVARLRRDRGAPKSFYWYLTKNNAQRNLETIEVLHDAGIATWVGLAVQDFDDEVLAAVKRDVIQTKQSLALRDACAARDIPTFNELILGLPGQTYASFTETVAAGMPGYPRHDFVLFLCRLIENAELGSPASRAEHGLVTVHSRWVTALDDFDPIVEEFQELVIATATMPPADWRRAYRFAFFAAAVHNLRLLRVILLVVPSVRDVVERLIEAPAAPGSVYAAVGALLDRYADSVVSGGPLVLPYDHAPGRRGAVDDAIARLVIQRYDAFLAETAAILGDVPAEAFAYQRLITPRPGSSAPVSASFEHDWPRFVAAGGTGAALEPVPTDVVYTPPPYAAIADVAHFAEAHFGSIRARLDVGRVTSGCVAIAGFTGPEAPAVAVPPMSG